jgi:catabolite regulation protein CreA
MHCSCWQVGADTRVAEDCSQFSVACRQVGPIIEDLTTLPDEEEVFSGRTSIQGDVYRAPGGSGAADPSVAGR